MPASRLTLRFLVSVAAFATLTLHGGAHLQAQSIRDLDLDGIPLAIPSAAGNFWYRYTESDTVLVFVHGVNSDAIATWTRLREAPRTPMYWPALVANDRRFRGAAIYVAGYPADQQPVATRVSTAIDMVIDGMSSTAGGTRSVLQRPHILFVTHSLGGIVVRGVLQRLERGLGSTDVGLLLIASPADGSDMAKIGRSVPDRIFPLGPAARSLLADLEPGNSFLANLNVWTERLIAQPTFPLVGASACETARIFLLFRVVNFHSCELFFGPSVHLDGMDHGATVKPSSSDHASHALLATFFQGPFQHLVQTSPNRLKRLEIVATTRRVGGKPGATEDTVDIPVVLHARDTLQRQEVKLSGLTKAATVTTTVTIMSPTDTGRRISLEPAGPSSLVLEIRPSPGRAGASIAPETTSDDSVGATVTPQPAPPTFEHDSAFLLRVIARREWIEPNVILQEEASAPLRLTPTEITGTVTLPTWVAQLQPGEGIENEFRMRERRADGEVITHFCLRS